MSLQELVSAFAGLGSLPSELADLAARRLHLEPDDRRDIVLHALLSPLQPWQADPLPTAMALWRQHSFVFQVQVQGHA